MFTCVCVGDQAMYKVSDWIDLVMFVHVKSSDTAVCPIEISLQPLTHSPNTQLLMPCRASSCAQTRPDRPPVKVYARIRSERLAAHSHTNTSTGDIDRVKARQIRHTPNYRDACVGRHWLLPHVLLAHIHLSSGPVVLVSVLRRAF